jgi:hypothetical protein
MNDLHPAHGAWNSSKAWAFSAQLLFEEPPSNAPPLIFYRSAF